jgi:hypothetical protein
VAALELRAAPAPARIVAADRLVVAQRDGCEVDGALSVELGGGSVAPDRGDGAEAVRGQAAGDGDVRDRRRDAARQVEDAVDPLSVDDG